MAKKYAHICTLKHFSCFAFPMIINIVSLLRKLKVKLFFYFCVIENQHIFCNVEVGLHYNFCATIAFPATIWKRKWMSLSKCRSCTFPTSENSSDFIFSFLVKRYQYFCAWRFWAGERCYMQGCWEHQTTLTRNKLLESLLVGSQPRGLPFVGCTIL